MFYLQRLRQILEERPERVPEPLVTPLPRPRSSSMVAATPSLVNTHKTQVIATRQQWRDCVEMPALRRHLRYLLSSAVFLQDMSLKCNEEEKSLSTETFARVSLTNLRRQAVPDLASDLGMNIFKKVRERSSRSLRRFIEVVKQLGCSRKTLMLTC